MHNLQGVSTKIRELERALRDLGGFAQTTFPRYGMDPPNHTPVMAHLEALQKAWFKLNQATLAMAIKGEGR